VVIETPSGRKLCSTPGRWPEVNPVGLSLGLAELAANGDVRGEHQVPPS
jgi:hypothetical protein